MEDISGEIAKTAVTSLLGQLATLLLDEAKLLGGVRGDVQFIKDEMDSMHGFLLDAADARQHSNQVQSWRRQVRDVAYESQNCIDRYVQTTLGASRPPAAGLLGRIRRVPHLVRTAPGRHRLASQIRDLKARARDVGERRLRYGVKAPPAGGASGHALPLLPSPLQEAAEHARRRRAVRAIADATDWINTDARQVTAWLAAAAGQEGTRHQGLPWYKGVTEFFDKMLHSQDWVEDFYTEYFTMLRRILGDQNPDNIIDFADIVKEVSIEIFKGEMHMAAGLFKKLFGLAPSAGSSLPAQHHDGKTKTKPPAAGSGHGPDPLERLKRGWATSDPREIAKAEAQYMAHLLESAKQVLSNDGIGMDLLRFKERRGPRLLVIVAPPVDAQGREGEDGEPRSHESATAIARRVYQDVRHSSRTRAGQHFDHVVWVDAMRFSQRRERLREVLRQLQPDDDGSRRSEMDTWKEPRLAEEIQKLLMGKEFLIFLADHKDNTPWADITPALPQCDGSDSRSTVVVIPMIHQATQYIGWYMLSNFFLLKRSRYRVYFYSHLVAVRKAARELLRTAGGGEDLKDVVYEILKRCRWDSFSTRVFLHALYSNPHQSKGQLERLLSNLDEFSTQSNARNMIRFSYNDLPSVYKTCFLDISVFLRDSDIRNNEEQEQEVTNSIDKNKTIRRTSLVRRWAAQGLVAGSDGMTRAEEAESCFNSLIARGLVQPVDSTPTGKVKSCTVDPQVFYFITSMSRDYRDAASTSSIDLPSGLAHRLSIPTGIQLSNMNRQAREGLKKQQDEATSQRVGSGTGGAGSQDSLDGMVKLLNLFPTSQSGWIKVLDLEGYRGLNKKHLKNICNKVFQVKYLSLRNTGIAELPKEIDKLQYLETFDLRGTKIKSFPSKSIVLPKLMHLLAGCQTDPPMEDTKESFSTLRIPCGIGSMTNMQILSHVEVLEDSDKEVLLNIVRLKQLRKLGVVIKEASHFIKILGMLNECLCSLSIRISDGEKLQINQEMSPIFSIPRFLTSLNIDGQITGLPLWIKQLEHLSKVTLRRTSLEENDILLLGDLANLLFIRLVGEKSYNKENLTFKKGFKNLEVLAIEGSDIISDIYFGEKAAPKLTKIVWTSKCRMESLGIDKLPSLEEIYITGDCDWPRINQSVNANPNNPILVHQPSGET